MKKALVFFLLIFGCLTLSPYAGREACAQGREWERQRAGTLPAQETPLTGTAALPVEYFISIGDTMEVLLFVNYDYSKSLFVPEKGPLDELQRSVIVQKTGKDVVPEKELPPAEYVIMPADVLDVMVWQNPDLSKEVIVGPDGQISYPLVGRIAAAGLTLGQLEAQLKEKISKFVRYPQVSVMVKKFGQVERVTWSNPDLSRVEVVVGPDGKISYPLVGRVAAAGLTLGQLETALTQGISKYIRNPKISVLVKKFAEGRERVIVLGEVTYPGIYNYQGSVSLLEAIALSGDFTEKAREDSVILIRGNWKEKPQVMRFNLKAALQKGTPDGAFLLQPNDVVYVPKSFIADFNKFLENIKPSLDTALSILDVDVRRQAAKWK